MKKITTMIFVFLTFIFIGCNSQLGTTTRVYYTPEYIFNLESVSLNGKEIKSFDKDNLKFENKDLSFSFKIEHKYIKIDVFNKQSDSLKLLWNDVIYIDYDGKSQGVIHEGTRFNQANSFQNPSSIASNSLIKDIIMPKNKIIFLSKWFKRDLLSSEGQDIGTFNTYEKQKATAEGSLYLNKKISLIVPIQNKDKTEEYRFDFLVKDFKIVLYDSETY